MAEPSKREAPNGPDKIGSLVQLTSPARWLAVCTLAGLCLLLVLWSMYGSVFVTVTGLGSIVPNDGQVTRVLSSASGIVKAVHVNVGDDVKEGDALIELQQPQLRTQAKAAQSLVELGEGARKREAARSARELESKQSITDKQVASQEFRRKSLQEQLQFQDKLIADMAQELSQGYVTRTQMEQARQSRISTELALREATAQIQTLRAQLDDARATVQKDLAAMDESLLKTRQQAAGLEESLDRAQRITARVSGSVVSVTTMPGKFVAENENVVTIESGATSIQAVTYFQISDGKQIQPGAQARLKVGSIDSDVYGTVLATVKSVADLPSSQASLTNMLENDALVSEVSKIGASLQVVLALVPEPGRPGYVKMASGRASPVPVTVGTTVSGSVIVQEARPISYVFRFFK
ncbi:NHLP bacteriocin system secretion protein [Ottowia thiooxydans]|uniref:NHLP bacteriocin system secretion protein n=1 Tax=Ottowia thiooxydans TaxID=219182 RepID=UPI0004296485|nr:NHLP bacteriocin system secretion protein [Ottowia thiooxydans]